MVEFSIEFEGRGFGVADGFAVKKLDMLCCFLFCEDMGCEELFEGAIEGLETLLGVQWSSSSKDGKGTSCFGSENCMPSASVSPKSVTCLIRKYDYFFPPSFKSLTFKAILKWLVGYNKSYCQFTLCTQTLQQRTKIEILQINFNSLHTPSI